MKTMKLIGVSLVLAVTVLFANASNPPTIVVAEAGTLSAQMGALKEVDALIVQGKINRQDLDWLNANCPNLVNLDLEQASIELWNDPEVEWAYFPANNFPSSFADNTRLKRLVLPTSLTDMGVSCLVNASSLTTVVCKNPTPPAADEDYPLIFSEATKSAGTLYVPQEAIAAYKQAVGWNFTTIKSIEEEGETPASAQYKLSEDGTTLLKWESNDKVVDFTADEKLSKITAIAANAFGNMSGGLDVGKVILPATLREIGSYAFGNCTKLKEVEMKDQVETIAAGAFFGCTSLKEIHLSTALKNLGKSAFSSCTELTGIEIPASIKTIENSTFYGCTQLKEVKWPSELEKINPMAFSNTRLQTLDLGATALTTIGGEAFLECEQLEHVILPQTLSSIEDEAFSSCSKLTRVEGLKDVPTIKSKAFFATQISSLDLQKTETIGAFTFGKTLIKTLVLPSSLKSIGTSAFEGCEQLEEVTFASNGVLANTGRKAFKGCTSLKKVALGNVPRVDDGSFFECGQLADIDWGTALVSIASSAFDACNALVHIELPQTLTEIEDWAFYECTGLESVTIGDATRHIFKEAFSCSPKLHTVKLGSDIQQIDKWVFRKCTALKEFHCTAANPPLLEEDVFSESGQRNATLYVTPTALSLYKGAEQWKEFGEIKAIETSSLSKVGQKPSVVIDVKSHTIAVKGASRINLYDLLGKVIATGEDWVELPSTLHSCVAEWQANGSWQSEVVAF